MNIYILFVPVVSCLWFSVSFYLCVVIDCDLMNKFELENICGFQFLFSLFFCVVIWLWFIEQIWAGEYLETVTFLLYWNTSHTLVLQLFLLDDRYIHVKKTKTKYVLIRLSFRPVPQPPVHWFYCINWPNLAWYYSL